MVNSTSTTKRWRLCPTCPPHVIRGLSDYHPVLVQVLYNRGQDTVERVRTFLEGGDGALHKPFAMNGMNEAVARIRRAINKKEQIAIYGDFDADGVTSTALLTQAISTLGGRVRPYIPNRVDEGYGLNIDALRALRDDGVKLVITVDCGIRAIEEVEEGNRLGLDMIVTDHHSVGDQLPNALAVINPKVDAKRRLEEGRTNGYPEDMLAGVGVAYKLAEALYLAAEGQSRGNKPNLKLEELLDLVALGTVADLAPLDRAENRELVRRGLAVLNRAKRPGIYELLQVAGIEPGTITTTTIGYMLGPRINAAGRLSSAMIAYDLLTENITNAGALAQQLQELNVRRQNLTLEAVEIARGRALSGVDADVPLIFDAGPEYLSGIVGLVAGRLCEEFYRPAVVVEQGEEESRGSCRSIPEFDITHALDQCADLLIRHGGHAQAAGFSVRNENLPILRKRLTELAQAELSDQDLRPALDVDAVVPFEYLTMDLAGALRQLEPTGARNEPPMFVTRDLRVVDVRRVGQDGKHLRLKFSAGGFNQIDGIAFKKGDLADRISSAVDVAYHLEINEWNGQTKLQLNVQDIRPPGPLD